MLLLGQLYTHNDADDADADAANNDTNTDDNDT